MTETLQDGFQVEVSMLGYEFVMGASALIGTRRSLNKVYMQMAGYGDSCFMDSAAADFLGSDASTNSCGTFRSRRPSLPAATRILRFRSGWHAGFCSESTTLHLTQGHLENYLEVLED